MRILFIHQNFPGQFKFLAPTLAANPANDVRVLTMSSKIPSNLNGIRVHQYQLKRGTSDQIHPWVLDLEAKVIRADPCFHAAMELREEGFTPDVIVAHPGWGESLFLKEVWPQAKLGIYCEFYYNFIGGDVGFDPEFLSQDIGEPCRLRMKNANNLMHFDIADGAISPTLWQASTFPEPFRSKISVIHDGIDTVAVAPNPDVRLTLNGSLNLTREDEVITFVNRNLEPYRGYHIFMRALPEILRRRPNARVLIVGGDDVSYGARPPEGTKWKDIFFDEVKSQFTADQLQRIHFLGHIPYTVFIPLLQLSRVHVYLTYPFVLSWSLLEAMSAGCAILASDTQPLHEAIVDGETGRLVDFFDHNALAEKAIALLDSPDERARLGQNARKHAQTHYDLMSVCLPRQIEWVNQLMKR